MDHQACPAPRENQATLGKAACQGSQDLREKLGSRAWQVILERREKQAFLVFQASRECVERKETREKKVNGDFLG